MVDEDAGLKGPGTGHVAHSIAATAQDHCRQAKTLDEADAVGVTAHAQVEAAQSISRQTVASTLQHHSLGAVPVHDVLNDGLEDGLVRDVVDSIPKRKIDRVVLARPDADVAQLARTREVFAVLVERDGHDAICGVEGLLDAVAVVDVDVDVEDSLVESQEFENAQHNV